MEDYEVGWCADHVCNTQHQMDLAALQRRTKDEGRPIRRGKQPSSSPFIVVIICLTLRFTCMNSFNPHNKPMR